MGNNSVDRSALGRMASIGDLYDARSDNFCGISIFKKNISQNALSLVDSHFSDIHLVHTDNFSEKFSKLEVKSELQVSVLAGMLSLEGSGRYLSDKKKSARTVKSSLIYNIKTKEESMNIYHEDIKDAFAIEAIESGVATHVVQGISWGANSVLSCLHENADKRDVKEIEGNLSAVLKQMSVSIRGNAAAAVDFSSGDKNNVLSFDVRIYGDILPKNEDLPTTFEGALALMKQLPRLVENSNGGKGKPLTYRLVPISLLKDYLKFQIKVDNVLMNLEESSLIRVVQLFDQLSSAQQQLNDFYQDAWDYKYCVSPTDMTKICVWKDNLTVQETMLRSKLSSVLTAVRSGRSGASDLEDLITEFQSSDLAPQKISHLLATWSSLTEKTNFVRTLIQHGAKYVGFGVSFDELILKCFEAKAYIFYFTDKSESEDSLRWKRNRQLFFHELKKKGEGFQYFAVDCTVHPTLMPRSTTSCIQILQSGVVIIEDYLVEQERLGSIPWAQSTIPIERILYPPNKRVPLSIVCTGNNCNPTQVYNWNCRKCEKALEYGFDQHVYCKCGKTLVTGLEFKCPDPKHGLNFEQHEQGDYLQELLDQLRLFPEINILIIGEMGTVKSNWVAAMTNFLTIASGEQSEVGEIELSDDEIKKFCLRIENMEVGTHTATGMNNTDGIEEGQSGTQPSMVYAFKFKNTTVHLINTMGIGDPKGIQQDKMNFQNHFGTTLSRFDEVHGIVFLVTPASDRLTSMFHFCTNELKTCLQPDISKNIVFCITNCKPENNITSLKTLPKLNSKLDIELTPNTIYRFETDMQKSSSILKSTLPENVDMGINNQFTNVCLIAWIDEMKRMLLHINSLKPLQLQRSLILDAVMIESLHASKIDNPNKMFNIPNDNKFECEICYSNKSECQRDYFVLTKCDKEGGHVFHYSHIAEWRHQQGRGCPVCTKPKPVNLHHVHVGQTEPEISTILLKIALIGDIATGKSCLAYKFEKGVTNLDSHPTIGFDLCMGVMQIGNWKVKLRITDLNCTLRFRSTFESQVKECDGIIFCYEKPIFRSLINVCQEWTGIAKQCNNVCESIILECKNDMNKSRFRERDDLLYRPTTEAERVTAGHLLGNTVFSVSVVTSNKEEFEAPFKYIAMRILANGVLMKQVVERSKSKAK